MGPLAWLVVQVGPDAGQQHPVMGGQALLGRSPDCQVVLADELASRRHAEICRQEWGWTIEDLGSKHGTLVNEEQLRPHTPHVLRSGSEVRVANTLLVFEEVYQEKDLGPEGPPQSEEGPPTIEVLRIHPVVVALIAVSVVLLAVLGVLVIAFLLSS